MRVKIVLILFVAAVVLMGAFTAGFLTGFVTSSVLQSGLLRPRAAMQSQLLNKPAPTVATTTLSGEPWSLAEYRGTMVLLVFWASWCSPCTAEIPHLKEVDERFGDRDDFEMVGVNLDDDMRAARRHIERYNLDWVQLHEENEGWGNSLAQAFGVNGIPSVWLIDREGEIAAVELRGHQIAETISKLVERQDRQERSDAPENEPENTEDVSI